jgi:peroxiredoxin
MRACLIIPALFVACGSVAVRTRETRKVTKVQVGEKFPKFGALDMDGDVFTTERLFSEKGTRGFIFLFFVSLCEPCKPPLIALEKAKKTLEEKSIVVVLIDLLEEPSTVKTFLQGIGVKSFRVIIDTSGWLVHELGLEGKDGLLIPLAIVVDPQGIVKGIFTGKGGKDYVEDLLKVF